MPTKQIKIFKKVSKNPRLAPGVWVFVLFL